MGIEHVGSTSVPGLAAKAIIDMDMIYTSEADFEQIKLRLAEIGYIHKGDLDIPQREVFKRDPGFLERHPILDNIDHHLYACPVYSEELKRHVLFRDYLRKHAWARQEYADMKRALAQESHQDKKAYSILKEDRARPWITSILEKAQLERKKMLDSLRVRQETEEDYLAVFELVEGAFLSAPHSDHTEHFLVERLRKSSGFIPELSLVAEIAGKVVGHILFTPVHITHSQQSHVALSLAPVAVHPDYQRMGIGRRLILAGHEIAKQLGYTSVVLVGHADYYPKFGYQQANSFGITFPFDLAPENALVKELTEQALSGIQGMVEYPSAFFGE